MANKFQSGHITATERETSSFAFIRRAQRQMWDFYQQKNQHQGQGMTLNEIRTYGKLDHERKQRNGQAH